MRACRNCGYLVPDAWDTCKRCHAALKDRVPAGTGARRATPYSPLAAPKPAAPKSSTSPPVYDANFAAPGRLGLPDGVAAAAPRADTSLGSASSEPWKPPTRSLRARLAAHWVRIVVAAVVLAVVLGGWRVVDARMHALPPQVQAYIHGDGEAYMPLGQGFTARLPMLPTESTQTVTVNGAVVTMHLALIQQQDWEAGIVTIDLPAPLPAAQVEDAMRSAFASGNSAVSGRLEKQDPVSHEGWPAMDAEIIPPDDHPLLTRIVVVEQKVYMLLAHSVNGTNRFFGELVDSFHAVR